MLSITSTTPATDNGHWRRTATGYQTVMPLMGHADVVLIECDGSTHPTTPLIEVWRADLGGPPLSGLHPSIKALISDGPLPYQVEVPVLPRSDIAAIAGTCSGWWEGGLNTADALASAAPEVPASTFTMINDSQRI